MEKSQRGRELVPVSIAAAVALAGATAIYFMDFGLRTGTPRDYDGYSRVGWKSRSNRGADGSTLAAATHHVGERRAAGDGGGDDLDRPAQPR